MVNATRLFDQAVTLEDWADTIRHWRATSEYDDTDEIVAFAEKALVYALDELRVEAKKREQLEEEAAIARMEADADGP